MLRVLELVPFVDGFGVEFDPQRHWDFVRTAKGDESFVPRIAAALPPYSGTSRDRPAGCGGREGCFWSYEQNRYMPKREGI
jgi:hypothetical protein